MRGVNACGNGALVMRNGGAEPQGGHPRATPSSRASLARAALKLLEEGSGEFKPLLEKARAFLGAETAFVAVLDDHYRTIASECGSALPDKMRRQPVHESICRHVVANGAVLRVDDAALCLAGCGLSIWQEIGVRSYLGVPLTLACGMTIGVLSAVDSKQRGWSEQDVETLNEFAAVFLTEIELLLRCEGEESSVVEEAGGGPLRHPSAMAAEGAPVRILIADGDDGLSYRFCDVLQAHGYEIDRIADCGKLAEAVSRRNYAMVLVDICGPERNGLAAAASIRGLGHGKGELPILAVASVGCRASIDACQRNGIDVLLTMPVADTFLVETIGRLTLA